jgi:predicted Zn-dependent peptidase
VAQPGASSYALVATPAPPLSDPSYPAFVVLKAILGEGHASRLFQHLRDSQGIGYSVGASWQTTLSDPMVAYLQWETRAPAAPAAEPPLDPETALRLLATEIDGLIANPPTEAEVRRARSISIGREALRHERARDRAFLLAWYEAIGAGAELDAALPSRLAAVTRVDVLSAARSYLGTRASVLIVPAR